MKQRYILPICYVMLLWLGASHAQEITDIDLDRIRRATVFVMQVDDNFAMTCVGSGTIVSYDGLILTNAHHTLTSASCPGTSIVISMTIDPSLPPVPKYRAQVVEANAGLDLAILRIVQEFDGRTIGREQLPALPFVDLANSDNVNLDDTVTIVGYSTLGNEGVSDVRATISAFFTEASGGERSWFKINSPSPIGGIVTGGGAYNAEGRLIGIPTTAPARGSGGGTTCLYLSDTNQDGFINTNDRCVLIGDFITILRPSSFARPLLRSASLGLTVDKLTSPDLQQITLNPPSFSRLYFAPSVVDGLPSTVIGSLPSGADSLYLFFDYANMAPETVYEVRVTLDGLPNALLSLPPVRWSGGVNGLWYVGVRGQTIPNGVYEYRLFIDGVIVGEQSIVVSGPPQSVPSFSNLVFGLLDERGNLTGNGYVLPVGATATGRFVYQNMAPGTAWTAIWYYGGAVIVRTDAVWSAEDGESGAYPISLQPIGGLLPGSYRLDLYIDGRLSVTGDFIIAGVSETALPRVFTGLEFFRTSSPLVLPTSNPATTFPDGANTIYAIFDWEQIISGTPWTLRWLVDGEVFYQSTVPWSSLDSGVDFTTRLTARSGLPDGSYRIELSVNNILVRSGEFSIGIGQLPIDQFAVAEGVTLRGQIVDANTLEGISSAVFYLISEEFSVGEFRYDTSQLHAFAITDRNGNFEIDRSLRLNAPYSILIEAQGYLPIRRDFYRLTPEDGNPIEMYIELSRD